MRIGINHQILPQSDEAFYEKYWQTISSWVGLIRLDSHMDAYAWRIDPYTTYSDGKRPMDTFIRIGKACKAAKIVIDFIRDGSASSPEWRALGGDWSTFDPPNTWRERQLPKEAWAKTNAWVNAAAKTLNTTGATCRWQGSNEQFNRNKDRYAYDRLKTIYVQPSYSRKWTSPALWGPRERLMKSLDEWLTLVKYERLMVKPEYVAVNVYPDWTPGVTVDTPSNVRRQVENLVLVNDWAVKHGLKLVIPEFGFAKVQVPEGEERRVKETAFVFQCAKLLPAIDTMTLYWDGDDYNMSLDGLAQLGVLAKMNPDDSVTAYVSEIQKQLLSQQTDVL